MFTKQILVRIINSIFDQQGSFDTHDVIKLLISTEPAVYKSEIQLRQLKSNPVHSLHTNLGVQVAQICQQLGFLRQQSRSLDIHGQQSRCLRWIPDPLI